ncbi:MAG TPA: SDR family oxidoreductase [Candidatus Acidoferrales bacterium]|nr:SDR family oxidoreductase [Candidatus Acidoferrales bacterium]
MGSKFADTKRAARWKTFQYDFPERSLAGKVVAVAGGSGGLGAALVALLAAEGAKIICGYRANRERAELLQRAMLQQFEAKIELVEGDIADAAVHHAYLAAVEKFGSPLTAAAIFPGDPARVKWEELDAATLESSLRANLVGPLLLARALGDSMESAGAGALVLLGTMQALAPFEGSVAYAAPKAALVHTARILAKQWKKVRVNCVAPGATEAGMAESSIASGKYDRFIESGAIPRFGRPEDVARAVRFFLDPDVYATGQVLLLDGGLTLRRDSV